MEESFLETTRWTKRNIKATMASKMRQEKRGVLLLQKEMSYAISVPKIQEDLKKLSYEDK